MNYNLTAITRTYAHTPAPPTSLFSAAMAKCSCSLSACVVPRYCHPCGHMIQSHPPPFPSTTHLHTLRACLNLQVVEHNT